MEKTINYYPAVTDSEEDLAVVVDMQNDFVYGALGTKEAQAIVPHVVAFLDAFQGKRVFTRDTHKKNYLETQEGRNLPIVHTVEGTDGWKLVSDIQACVRPDDIVLDKPTFGSLTLADVVKGRKFRNIYLLGVCTGICVISNGVISKAADPEAAIHVLAGLCACVTPESHATAIAAMRLLQMDIMEPETVGQEDA